MSRILSLDLGSSACRLLLTEKTITNFEILFYIEKTYAEPLRDTFNEENRIIRAFKNAKIYKSDLSGKADSIHFNKKNGLAKLININDQLTNPFVKTKKPILWSQANQITGDSIHLLFNINNDKLDWSMAEHLAYGSLLEEGFNVRISGQDVERGTFSHRHSVIKVEESEEEIILHNNISESQGTFSIYNSLLSEYGVLGFEYGYAMSNPNTLTIWEAQFGDFSNGAQIIIDQYIFSGEDKWKTPNGIVLLLPHGYEGQGAEHSSARVERYLQLCAKDNVFVANCTTPANIYHLLRRQMKTNYRKPLIIFTPKSLLRHSRVFSSVDELTKGGFQVVIDDNDADPKIIESLVFVTGKFYYDLLEEKEGLGRKNMAIVRIEQLFPLPKEVIRSTIKKYSNASDIVWAQEEPRNMGAYGFLLMNLKEAKDFRIASRRNYGATAAGSSMRFQKRHKEVIEYVFNPEKDNQILK